MSRQFRSQGCTTDILAWAVESLAWHARLNSLEYFLDFVTAFQDVRTVIPKRVPARRGWPGSAWNFLGGGTIAVVRLLRWRAFHLGGNRLLFPDRSLLGTHHAGHLRHTCQQVSVRLERLA